jgi:hypothetical protein
VHTQPGAAPRARMAPAVRALALVLLVAPPASACPDGVTASQCDSLMELVELAFPSAEADDAEEQLNLALGTHAAMVSLVQGAFAGTGTEESGGCGGRDDCPEAAFRERICMQMLDLETVFPQVDNRDTVEQTMGGICAVRNVSLSQSLHSRLVRG